MSSRYGCASRVVAFVVTIGGCATTRVSTDYDSRANFRNYRTFVVEQGQILSEGRPDPGDTLVRDRVDAALSAELAEKGLRPNEGDPDLIVRYTAQTYTRPEVRYDPGWGVGPFWLWGPYSSLAPYYPVGLDLWYPVGLDLWVDHVEEGKMTIEVIDADSNKLVYRAETEAEEKNFRSPKYIRKAIEKALAKYPEQRLPATS